MNNKIKINKRIAFKLNSIIRYSRYKKFIRSIKDLLIYLKLYRKHNLKNKTLSTILVTYRLKIIKIVVKFKIKTNIKIQLNNINIIKKRQTIII